MIDFERNLQIRRSSQPARSYLWSVELPDLSVSPSNGSKSASFLAAESDANVGYLDMELLNTLVTSINTPFFTFDTDKVTDGNTFWYKSKHNDISNVTIAFEETEKGLVWSYLNAWKNLVINSNGGYNPPSFYKRDIIFRRMDITKSVYQEFAYRNYFISEMSAQSNDYNTNDVLQYTASFTGDSLEEISRVVGSSFDQRLERVSEMLGNIQIPYNQFQYDGIASTTVANVLKTFGTQSFGR